MHLLGERDVPFLPIRAVPPWTSGAGVKKVWVKDGYAGQHMPEVLIIPATKKPHVLEHP